MREKAEAKKNNPQLEERKSIVQNSSEMEIDENDKAWSLRQQLKSRMQAMQGARGKKNKNEQKKRIYKRR